MIRNLLRPQLGKVKCRFVTQTIPLGPLPRVTSPCLAISPWPKYPKSRPHPPNHRPEQGANFGAVTHRTPPKPSQSLRICVHVRLHRHLHRLLHVPPRLFPLATAVSPWPKYPNTDLAPPNNDPGKSLPPLRNHAQKITKPFPISLILYARPSAPPSAPPAAQPIAPFPLSKPPCSR